MKHVTYTLRMYFTGNVFLNYNTIFCSFSSVFLLYWLFSVFYSSFHIACNEIGLEKSLLKVICIGLRPVPESHVKCLGFLRGVNHMWKVVGSSKDCAYAPL